MSFSFSPKSEILELEDFAVDPIDCCSNCNSARDPYIPSTCVGSRDRWLRSRIAQISSRMSSQQLPFVLKLQQTFGGSGTYLIRDCEDLAKVQLQLANIILPKLFSQVNASNAHLHPATIVLSEMIQDPVGNWGLTFFLTQRGRCIFLGASYQAMSSNNAWIGSGISYLAQNSLEQKFTPIMHKIGSWLRSYGYFGPCGADILETVDHEPFKIVDLNVRPTGSIPLGLLKGHFADRRQLYEACLFSMTVRMSRASFIHKFEDRISQGRMILASWYEDPSSDTSYGCLIVGARDRRALERDVGEVKSFASDVEF